MTLSDEEIDDLETWDGNDLLEQLDVVTGHDLGHAFLSQAREANRLRAALAEALEMAQAEPGAVYGQTWGGTTFGHRLGQLYKLLDGAG